ncbi:hypothetical protein [Methylobacterium sp. ID0610]|uniref:hypothetical protein n=1 Tax=Methylobacterium carpenticola TaxID=3344827 RepID=UPI003676211E
MAKAVSLAGSMIWSVVLPVGLALIFFLNFNAVSRAFRDLLAMTSRVQSLKAGWVEFTLKDRDRLVVSLENARITGVDAGEQQTILSTIKALNGLELQRLFSLEENGVHCQYSKPTSEMRMFSAVDFDLEQAGLITSTYDEEATTAASDRRFADIGAARSCYRLAFTPRGFNVKTVLVGVIRDGFDGGVAIAGEKP